MPQNILTVENSAVSVLLFQALNAGKLTGPMAQRIRHLTTNQGIAGSNPARVKNFYQIFFCLESWLKKYAPPGGLEPPTFRLTAERASRLRHGGMWLHAFVWIHLVTKLCELMLSYNKKKLEDKFKLILSLRQSMNCYKWMMALKSKSRISLKMISIRAYCKIDLSELKI